MTPRHAPRYTPADDEYIRQNYSKLPVPVIAARLDRPESSIRQRACRLGVKRGRKPIVYAPKNNMQWIEQINGEGRRENLSYGDKVTRMEGRA